ncbi:hypothetical protein Tco_0882763 [Tanacetum coccineum]
MFESEATRWLFFVILSLLALGTSCSLDAIAAFRFALDMFNFENKIQTRMERITINEYELESKVSVEDDLFTYELGVVEEIYFLCVEQPCDNLKNGDLDVYEPRKCYDEYEKMFVEAVILIDSRLVKLIYITLKQWLCLKFGDHKKVDNEIMEEVVSTWFVRSYRKQFEEYMMIRRRLEVNGLDTDVECDPTNVEFAIWGDEEVEEKPWLDDGTWEEPNDDICHDCKPFQFKSGHWYEGLEDGDLKNEALKEKSILEGSWGHENREGKNFCSWLKESFEWFDNHEPMEGDDDDIGDLDDYLIPQDASYYVDEEEERFKERKSKLLGIPYEKPPTFKSEKFEDSIRRDTIAVIFLILKQRSTKRD